MLQRPRRARRKSRNSSGFITPLTKIANQAIVKVQDQPSRPMVHFQWLGATGSSRGSNRLLGICVLSRTRLEECLQKTALAVFSCTMRK